MDKTTDKLPANILAENTDDDCSDDDVPLSKLLKRPKNADKQVLLTTQSLSSNTKNESGKEGNGLDNNTDDEHLIRKRKPSAKALTSENEEEDGGVIATDNKEAGLSGQDSSDDDVPLIKLKNNNRKRKLTGNPPSKDTVKNGLKQAESSNEESVIEISKVSSNAVKNGFPTKPPLGTDTETLGDYFSSDEEPLSELAKRLKSQRQKGTLAKSRKTSRTGGRMKAPKKMGRSAAKDVRESSSDSSDDEPLIEIKKRLSEEKASTNYRKPKMKGRQLKDPLSSDESSDGDVPLINLIGKLGKPVGRRSVPTKKNPAPRKTPAARKIKAISDEDNGSDDEPLINLVKKPLRDTTSNTVSTAKATPPKKRAAASVRKRKMSPGPLSEAGLSSSSDDEPLMKIMTRQYPQVTKFLRVALNRCSGGEVGRGTARECQGESVPENAEEETSPEDTTTKEL